MKLPTQLTFAAIAGATLFVGLSPILPANGQDAPQVRGRVIIRTPDGEQVIDLDPSQLPALGEGKQMVIVRAGPNGEITTFAGSPDMMVFGGNGGGGLAYNLPGSGGPNAGPLAGLSVIDPGTSYLYALLKRIDVASEIHLNARQREALEAAETNQQEARKEQMKQSVQALTGSLKDKSPEDLRAAMTERAQKLREQTQGFTDARLKTLASILRPEQLARLKQLDLQFRGPLSMGVNDVAQQAALNKDQTATVAGLLKEYRQEVSKNLAFGARTVSFKPGSAPAPAPPAPDSEEMRVKLVKADKQIRLARMSLAAKALTSLPAEQRAQWSKLTGKPFEFHPAL